MPDKFFFQTSFHTIREWRSGLSNAEAKNWFMSVCTAVVYTERGGL